MVTSFLRKMDWGAEYGASRGWSVEMIFGRNVLIGTRARLLDDTRYRLDDGLTQFTVSPWRRSIRGMKLIRKTQIAGRTASSVENALGKIMRCRRCLAEGHRSFVANYHAVGEGSANVHADDVAGTDPHFFYRSSRWPNRRLLT